MFESFRLPTSIFTRYLRFNCLSDILIEQDLTPLPFTSLMKKIFFKYFLLWKSGKLENCTYIFFPHLGKLLPIKIEENKSRGIFCCHFIYFSSQFSLSIFGNFITENTFSLRSVFNGEQFKNTTRSSLYSLPII